MYKQRYIRTSFWSDPYKYDLNKDEKLMYLYLMTNSQSNLAGVYEISPKQIMNETGFTQSQMDKVFDKFEDDKEIGWFGNYVVLRNYPSTQSYSGQMLINAAKTLEVLPKELFESERFRYFIHPIYSRCKRHREMGIEKLMDNFKENIEPALTTEKPKRKPGRQKKQKEILLADLESAPAGGTSFQKWAVWFYDVLKPYHKGKNTFDNAKLSVWEADFKTLFSNQNRSPKEFQSIINWMVNNDDKSLRVYIMSPGYFKKEGGKNYDVALGKYQSSIIEKAQNTPTLGTPRNEIYKPEKE